MSEKDFNAGVTLGLFMGLAGAIVFFCLIVIPNHVDASHEALGSVGHACFANNTCRNGLTCLHGAGAEPGTCSGRR